MPIYGRSFDLPWADGFRFIYSPKFLVDRRRPMPKLFELAVFIATRSVYRNPTR
jgi:hypothetical protein